MVAIGEFDHLARKRNAMSRDRQQAQDASRRRNHIDDVGFPHFSSASGLCMCLEGCCLGPSGCKCGSCPCDPATGHSGETTAQRSARRTSERKMVRA